jgi:hypothetical protein
MKPGDLRRFRDGFHAVGAEHLRGRVFMVLEVIMQGSYAAMVNILVPGGVQLEWGYPWVKENSEVINEAG